ncbi:hypothetical protein [Embleya sp. NBC_00896]|uniref:hypothetical protein n=1 Tax=Embleya sp. NBC_00896 TaxID=2975961 RepID=UPI00386A4072|nr:hypothetical protein OG928_18085 [Embleya sp. NBC_00896]
MAITETGKPAPVRPAALARGFLGGALFGAAVAGLVVGSITERMYLIGVGIGLFFLNVAMMAVGAYRERAAGTEHLATRPALALIESRRAIGGETANVPVEFVLTVAPDDGAAYRVKMSQSINLVDIPDYRPGGVIVVQYRPAQPWHVEIVDRPTQEWHRRAAGESLDSAPESAMVAAPAEGGSFCLLGVVGLLIGAAAVVLPFRAELFTDDTPTKPASSSSSSTSSTSSSTITMGTFSSTSTLSGSATSDSTLRKGEMRRVAESLIAGMGTANALRLDIDEHLMSVEGAVAPATDTPVIDLRALPYERLPALVREAQTTLGIGTPKSWRIGFAHDAKTGALLIRVSVTGDRGDASLEANPQGDVTRRNPR